MQDYSSLLYIHSSLHNNYVTSAVVIASSLEHMNKLPYDNIHKNNNTDGTYIALV